MVTGWAGPYSALHPPSQNIQYLRPDRETIVTIEQKLARMGLHLEEPVSPMANYVPAVVTPPFVFTSGASCMVGGKPEYLGKIGQDLTLDQGYDAARLTILSLLAKLKEALGSLERVERIVRLTGYVNCLPDFTDHSKVMDGASNLLVELLGDSGRHARTVLGLVSLPMNLPLEIDMVVRIRD